MTAADHPELQPLRAMTARLAPMALAELAAALHARIYQPELARTRRLKELGPLARLLDTHLQPPERRPYVERKIYEATYDVEGAPAAALLVEHYGSWKRACYAAWTLHEDGSWTEGGLPWPTTVKGKPATAAYTAKECVASIHACAEAISRIPSSMDYLRWRANRVARARRQGASIRLASVARILALLAPERGKQDGWQIALGVACPELASDVR